MLRKFTFGMFSFMIAGNLASRAADPQFEVASVRALAPVQSGTNGGFRMTGGPGTKDPEHIRYTQAAMLQILARTFQMQPDQLIGPGWITQPFGAERFEIIANVPAGSRPEQVPLMMENLLKERFHLAYHREKRTLDAFELVVAKGGPKLKAAEVPRELPQPKSGEPAQAFRGDDGYPNLPAGWPEGVGLVEGRQTELFFDFRVGNQFRLAPQNNVFMGPQGWVWRLGMRMITTSDLATLFQGLQGVPHIVDHTGLAGQYDIKLRFASGGSTGAGEISEPAPDIFQALEEQLGLTLHKTKIPLDVIVIDRIDKTPSEN